MQHSCTTRRTQPANAIFTAAGVSLFVARFFSVSSWCRASSSSSSPLPPPCAPGFFKEVHSFLFPLCSTFFPLFVFASFSFFLFFFLFFLTKDPPNHFSGRVCACTHARLESSLCAFDAHRFTPRDDFERKKVILSLFPSSRFPRPFNELVTRFFFFLEKRVDHAGRIDLEKR